MFICLSPNPAIDTRLTLPLLEPGHVLRARSSRGFPGGKSAHVAMVLRTLGEIPRWVGFSGGATGMELVAGLHSLGIATHPCATEQPTRTNLEIVEDGGRVTEILEPGTAPSATELNVFEGVCKKQFAQAGGNGVVIFSGSLPGGVAPELYVRLIALARQFQCATFLDASGDALRLALAAQPQFVKPNREEAGALLGMSIDSVPAAARALRKVLALGARSAALSLGAEGLLFCAGIDAAVLFAPGLSLPVRSAVGCGDSALAGFACGFSLKASPEDVLRLAAACAAANCLAASPGGGSLANIQRFKAEIRVQTLSDDS
jgi:tagatose 6-phosphate kinase